MLEARRFGDSYCQRFDIGYAFVKGAISFRIPDGLLEQIYKMIEECVLVINVERQYAVKESRHVVKIFFPHFFASVAVSDKQANIPQRLTRVRESWDIAVFDYAPEHETQSRSSLFGFKVVLGEVAAIGAAPVAFGQCSQTAKPSRDGGAKALLAA